MLALKKISLLSFLLLCPFFLFAQVIVLKDAKDAPVPIAIQPFSKPEEAEVSRAAIEIEAMLTADLIFSRLFKVIPAEAFLEEEVQGPLENFQVGPWRQTGAHYVVRGQLSKAGSKYQLTGYVFNVSDGKMLLRKLYETTRKDYTILAHQFGDEIVKIVTGQDGLFSTKISFVYQPPVAGKGKEIWMMDFNGRNSVPLVQNGRVNLSPTWTRDGRSIVYTSASLKDWHLWTTSLEGKSKQISNFPGSALGPAMLPNGREMVVSLSKDGNPELYVMGLDGKIKSRLTKSAAIDIGPSASPDGKEICFSSGQLGALHIFVMPLIEGAKPERRTRLGTLNDSCAWHPSQNEVLFSGMDTDREFDIFKMNSNGNNMERLTYDSKNNETPSWSPDGNLIVYSSRETGRNEIWVMRADGSQKVKITDLNGDASQPDWSPRLGY